MQESLGFECELAYKASSFLSGGIAGTGSLCGALSGGLLVLGMKYGRANPRHGSIADSSGPALKLFKWFEKEYGGTTCCDITGPRGLLDKEARAKFRVSEAHLKCFRISGEVAAKVVDIITRQGSRQVSLDEAIAELHAQGLL